MQLPVEGTGVAGTHALGSVVVPAHVETGVEAAVQGGEMGEHRGRLDDVDRRKDWRQGNGGREAIVTPTSPVSLTVTWKEESN